MKERDLSVKERLAVVKAVELGSKYAGVKAAGYGKPDTEVTRVFARPRVKRALEKEFKKEQISVEYVLKGIKEIAEDIESTKAEKLKALELFGKYLKMFTEKVELDILGDIQISWGKGDKVIEGTVVEAKQPEEK